MRLIHDFSDERKAYTFCQYLAERKVEASYESIKEGHHCVWVVEEDDFERSLKALEEFQQLPEEQQRRFDRPKTPKMTPKGVSDILPPPVKRRVGRAGFVHIPFKTRRMAHPHQLTHFLLLLCTLIFFWNLVQEGALVRSEGKIALQRDMTPLQEKLMFDDPGCFKQIELLLRQYPLQSENDLAQLPSSVQQAFAKAAECSYWKGFYDLLLAHLHPLNAPRSPLVAEPAPAPLFEKIREGEIWRLFTPTLLHRDFLHIIFNMSWLIYLGHQIEERIGKWRMLLLVLLIGIVSNTAQYLMGGPYFLGFSGVAVGFAGFIWMRQRVSPWEGYPLSQSTAMFLLVFILGLVFLDWLSIIFQLFGKTPFAANIANTAHITGGIIGLLLARIPLFAHKS